MAEPLGVEERARLLAAWPWPKEAATTATGFDDVVAAVEQILAAQVDRLTEERDELWQLQITTGKKLTRAEADLADEKRNSERARTELRAEMVAWQEGRTDLRAQLADEQRRHGELRAGVEALAKERTDAGGVIFGGGRIDAAIYPDELRALLSDATTATGDECPVCDSEIPCRTHTTTKEPQ